MRRYIVLLFISGIVWAQTDLDKLVLKDGTIYLGEYSKIEGKKVYFKPQGAFAFQPVSVKQIQTLKLKDGKKIVSNGKVKVLSIEAYEQLSTKEKALHDAELINLGLWAFYGPLSGISLYLSRDKMMSSQGSIASSLMISLTIPYLILNLKKVKFSYPKSLANEYDRLYYKKVYYENIRKRKGNMIMASIAITGGVAYLLFSQAMSDLDFGGGGSNWGMGGYSGP